jgi:hypothetical protein
MHEEGVSVHLFQHSRSDKPIVHGGASANLAFNSMPPRLPMQ